MNRIRLLIAVALAAWTFASGATAEPLLKAPRSGDFTWENAIIHLEISGKEYSYVQPWARA